MSDWYGDWQETLHVSRFDGRAQLARADLVRNCEALNDVRLLNERFDRSRAFRLLEVGCATGEFYRYLRIRYPQAQYDGLDISEAAIARARQKYPSGRFFVCRPEAPAGTWLALCGRGQPPEVLYAKDVVHHQLQPFEFMAGLLEAASDAVILRLRTRDVGATVLDPEQSCQHHYRGWMPYIVMNLQEVIERIQRLQPRAEVVVYRRHVILGGQERRFLPKACYVPETGTAETAVGVFRMTDRPGVVTVTDRPESPPPYSLVWQLRRAASAARRRIHARLARAARSVARTQATALSASQPWGR